MKKIIIKPGRATIPVGGIKAQGPGKSWSKVPGQQEMAVWTQGEARGARQEVGHGACQGRKW